MSESTNGQTTQPTAASTLELQWVNEARSTARVKVAGEVFEVAATTLRSYAAFRGRCALEGILFAVPSLAALKPADRAERWLELVARVAADRHKRDRQAQAARSQR